MNDTEIVASRNTATENAAMVEVPEDSPLARLIAEENEKRARHLRKIAKLNGEL